MNDLMTMDRIETIATVQADSDGKLIALWLHGRSAKTQAAYSADAQRLIQHVGKPLHGVTLADLQAFADSLNAYATASQARMLASVKSLFAFAHRLGYLPFDVARVIRLPHVKSTLAERIVTEAQMHSMIALETSPRNKMILRLLYAAGVRVSELTGLCWRDVQERANGEGQITVYGKGGKTRAIALPASVYGDLIATRGTAGDDEPVFESREGGAIDQSQINRIVHAAAKRASVKAGAVSPHYFRHAHASHSIDRGAPISLVQATLGHASTATTGRYLHARPGESSARFLAV